MKNIKLFLFIVFFLLSPAILLATPIKGNSYPVYVVDSNEGAVYRIDSDTTQKPESPVVSGLALPRSITYSSDGKLYIGQENGNILVANPQNGTKELFTTVSGHVRGLAFGTDGYLYVGKENLNIVTKINPITKEESTFASGFCSQGLAFDSSGDLYVATGGYGNNEIKRIETDGTIFNFATTNLNPVPLTFDLEGFPDGYLLSSENQAGNPVALISMDSTGNIVERFTFSDTVSPINGIAVASDGYIYLSRLHSILKLDSNFNEVQTIDGFDYLFGMTTVPEPATLFLLAFGGLFLQRKKL